MAAYSGSFLVLVKDIYQIIKLTHFGVIPFECAFSALNRPLSIIRYLLMFDIAVE